MTSGLEIKRHADGTRYVQPYMGVNAVTGLRTIIRVDVPKGDPHWASATISAIDEYREVRPW